MNTYSTEEICSGVSPVENWVMKKLSSSAAKRLAAAAPRGPKRSPAQSKGKSNWNLYGPMTPAFATSKCPVSPINTDNSRAASSNLLLGDLKCVARYGPNQVRIKGVSNKMAIALLPHQTLNDCANEWLEPVMLNVAAPSVPPSIVLNSAQFTDVCKSTDDLMIEWKGARNQPKPNDWTGVKNPGKGANGPVFCLPSAKKWRRFSRGRACLEPFASEPPVEMCLTDPKSFYSHAEP